MIQAPNHKQYDLEERTLLFTQRVIQFSQKVKITLQNEIIVKQLIKSAGSVGANYIEANESLSKKDFILRIKISKKEAKEARYWLKLIILYDIILKNEREILIRESTELMKIFGAILEKSIPCLKH